MALRLRRDVQKASYYVWFLGAEEAKGLRGSRVINSVLPYLIDRSRDQEPLKVTLQISHKGIKILQGSSKHFIPHSAITSSVLTDDIVACVLLLYNPATKCPLHVHAYRCDSETTAEALQQQLQTLINRPENQKRFEELEMRLGILQIPTNNNKSSSSNNIERSGQRHFRRLETSPKRFSSSLGSDTGNSTRESECSEERDNVSPMSRSPPTIIKQLTNNDLFDSLAAELRAKLNGNGPPLLLPPRDYDTVHRSKGNLAAIELRRCRNSLIVGSTTPQPAMTAGAAVLNGNGAPIKQVSSRGSSGIGSDLAPSPERQDIHSSSDDEHWSNEADNSVIALKPSQIAIERSAPVKQHHLQMNRKSAVQPPEDNYLRDLPSKPYNAQGNGSSGRSNSHSRDKDKMMIITGTDGDRAKKSASPASSLSSWNREDEIKPIIMRPYDYDTKLNRILMERSEKPRPVINDRQQTGGKIIDASLAVPYAKLHDTDKYNEINRLLNKKHSLERDSPNDYHNNLNEKIIDDLGVEYDESDGEPIPMHTNVSNFHKDNLTDKQKFQEYSSKGNKGYPDVEPNRYGGRQRYVDPNDLPFEQPTKSNHNKYPGVHRSPERDKHRGSIDRHRDYKRESAPDANRRQPRDRECYSHSNERNPYREPESLPYIESMEKMMKSAAMRYKSFENTDKMISEVTKENEHPRVSLRKSYPKSDKSAASAATTHHSRHNEEHKVEKEFSYNRSQQQQYRVEYNDSSNSTRSPKDRFKDAKEKFKAMERSGSRYSIEEKDGRNLQRRSSIEPVDTIARPGYDNWSEEEEPITRSRSRTRDHWEKSKELHGRDLPREHISKEKINSRDMARDQRDYREMRDNREHRVDSRDAYRSQLNDHPSREFPRNVRDSGINHRDFANRPNDNHGSPALDIYPSPKPVLTNTKNLPNLTKGYRHSYAEPVFPRTGGRVGLAAVNPF